MASKVVATISIDPTTPPTIYAGAAGGALDKTLDGGGTWKDVRPRTRRQIWTIAIDPKDPRKVYLGTAGDGIFETTTGAES
jgi:photosystem II stability/assembly factor-like uncharacterized protein